MMLARTSAFNGSGYTGHCAVTAVHEVAQADWSAADVLQAARENGFPHGPNGGWDVQNIEAGMDALMLEWRRMYYGDVQMTASGKIAWSLKTPKPTLAQFMRAHPTGTHIVILHGHAAVVRDGVVIDPNWGGRRAARRRVWISYTIDNAGPQKYAPASLC
jgi:hypothetical protein